MAVQVQVPPMILTRKQVEAHTSLSRSFIYAAIAAGTFPPQIRLGQRSVGWLESEVTAWINTRVAESRRG